MKLPRVGRSLTRLIPVVALAATGLVISGTPAQAASCTELSGSQFGVDTTAAVGTVIVYDLIGFADLSPGCATGELDIVAAPAVGSVGTASTCTFVLPQTPGGSGTGCDGLLGVSGVGVGGGVFRVTLAAELTAVGTDGSRVTRTATCTVAPPASPGFGPRCPI